MMVRVKVMVRMMVRVRVRVRVRVIFRVRATLEPVRPSGRRSQSMRWFSVPLVVSLYPLPMRNLASACAFARTCLAYALNSGVATSLSCVARPAIW